MTSNIYEDPNLTMKAKFCRGVDRAERAERVVDIYEGVTIYTGGQNQPSAGDGGAHGPSRPAAAHRSCFRAEALILSLLLILLLAAVAILTKLFLMNMILRGSNNDLQSRYDQLSHSFCVFGDNSTVWTRFQCSCYFESKELKSWTESRADCRTRGADLVVINNKKELDFLKELKKNGASWIGLESVTDRTDQSKWEWRWVDGAEDHFYAWAKNVTTTPLNASKVFLNHRGKFVHSTNGLKGWICERPIKDL